MFKFLRDKQIFNMYSGTLLHDAAENEKSIFKLDLAHRRTDANCIHRKDNAPKPLGPIISEL